MNWVNESITYSVRFDAPICVVCLVSTLPGKLYNAPGCGPFLQNSVVPKESSIFFGKGYKPVNSNDWKFREYRIASILKKMAAITRF